MVEALESKILVLSQELSALKAERDRLTDEANGRAQERNRLHERIRELRLETHGLREKRDGLNSEVQRFKALREQFLRDYHATIEELKRLRRGVKEATSRKPSRSQHSLEDEIGKIEWRIQTESLPIDEERRLIGRVKALETQLEAYRNEKRILDRIATLQSEAEELSGQVSVLRIKMSEVVEQSQAFHEKMIGHLQEAKKLKAKADEIHWEYIDRREKANVLRSKCLEILHQIRAIREQVRRREEKEKAGRLSALRERLEQEALGKLKRGERLTFEEFKILAEKGKV